MAGARKEKRVGRYEVGRTIGHGTFAKVKLAVAMKVLDKDAIVRHRMLHQVHGHYTEDIGVKIDRWTAGDEVLRYESDPNLSRFAFLSDFNM